MFEEVLADVTDEGILVLPKPLPRGRIEKAIRFYVGYITAGEDQSYLPNAFLSTMKSIVAESDNRQNRMLFKLAVEMAMMMNLIAAEHDIDPVSLERLRGECVKEVKRLNGGFSLEDAYEWQKG